MSLLHAENTEVGHQSALDLYRLSVDQYHSMTEAGILYSGENVELLEGLLVCKEKKTPRHSFGCGTVADLLRALLIRNCFVTHYDPITMDDSEPEPDVSLILGDIDDYMQRHPYPAEVALAIEVADSKIMKDRTIKQRIYARAGIPVYWIVNLENRKLEVYTQPGGSGATARYVQRVELDETASVEVVIAGTVVGTIPVREMLP
jgi:Uma2 family endonuclease